VALRSDPSHYPAYETRGLVLLNLQRYKEALPDADSLLALSTDKAMGYSIRGTAYMYLDQPEKAVTDFTSCLEQTPKDDCTLNNRGTTLYNSFKKYREALDDFNKAIAINPLGNYFLNRSRCYYMLGDTLKAKADVREAMSKGMDIPQGYRSLLNL